MNLFDQFDKYLATGEMPGQEADTAPAEGGDTGVRPAESGEPGRKDLSRFHLFDKNGRVRGVYDWEVCRYLRETQDYFVLGGVPYLYGNGCYRADETGAKLKDMIQACLYPEFIKAPTIRRVYDLATGSAACQETFDGLNQYPPQWINFQNGFYDPVSGMMYPHDPRYRAVNQIPHYYDPAARPRGNTVENWLRFITPDPEDREMLLEFAGYCMTRDVSQQKFLILNGEGGTGKSTVIRLIEAMIGRENISSISLSELTQRFSVYGLLGKLLNACADLELTALEDTGTIKKVLGEDTLRAEAKGKDAFSFRSYARLIFSTNELPIVKAERSNGFYRRLLILTMNRTPGKVNPGLFDKLNGEIGYFIRLCVDALRRMYERGRILSSAHSDAAVEQFRMDSDTVAAFLAEKTVAGPGRRVERGALFSAYKTYCFESDRQALSRNNFYRSMRVKGYGESAAMGTRYFDGLALGHPGQKGELPGGYIQVDEPVPF